MNTDTYNRPQRKSNRLPEWNYGNLSSYYLTICTKDRLHFFGEIYNSEMNLTPAGDIARTCWLAISNHFDNVELGEFVIMPNHIHGIINIRDHADRASRVPTNRFQNIGKKTLSSIVGSYKSAVSRIARKNNFDFYWQPRFYDHVIRNEKDYQRNAEYIIYNPLNWENDENNIHRRDRACPVRWGPGTHQGLRTRHAVSLRKRWDLIEKGILKADGVVLVIN